MGSRFGGHRLFGKVSIARHFCTIRPKDGFDGLRTSLIGYLKNSGNKTLDITDVNTMTEYLFDDKLIDSQGINVKGIYIFHLASQLNSAEQQVIQFLQESSQQLSRERRSVIDETIKQISEKHITAVEGAYLMSECAESSTKARGLVQSYLKQSGLDSSCFDGMRVGGLIDTIEEAIHYFNLYDQIRPDNAQYYYEESCRNDSKASLSKDSDWKQHGFLTEAGCKDLADRFLAGEKGMLGECASIAALGQGYKSTLEPILKAESEEYASKLNWWKKLLFKIGI